MKIALNKKLKGAIAPVCAYAFKRPPQLLSLETGEKMFERFVIENA
jgi:myo-inositol-1-phosphate synthase